jgi:predicted nucleic acid-binding protein
MTQNTKVLLDTNILIYSTHPTSEFRNNVERTLSNYTSFYIVDRSLLEFYRVYTGPLKQTVAETLSVLNFYQNNPNYTILTSTELSNQLTFELANDYQAKSGKIFDLNILAIALENNIEILYTKNTKDYPENSEIQVIDPTL